MDPAASQIARGNGGRRFALIVVATYILVSLFRLIFQGLLEPSAYDVPHREAGAGDLGLILQLFLALAVIVGCIFWIAEERRWIPRLLILLLALAAPALFLFTAGGMARQAPGYSEAAFRDLEKRYENGAAITRDEVIARLGAPLCYGPDSIWVYTYMPSCGFGWSKRFVTISPEGRATRFFAMDEP